MAESQKINKIVNEIFSGFFTEEQKAEIEKLFRRSRRETKTDLKISKRVKEQVEFEPADQLQFSTQVDLLITFSKTRLDPDKFIELLFHLGQTSIILGEFKTALDIFERIIRVSKNNSVFKNLEAHAHLEAGNIHSRQAKWESSFQAVRKAENIFKSQNDPKGCAMCENMLGTIYGDMGDLKKSTAHFESALDYIQDEDDYDLIGRVEINLGIVNNIRGNYDQALSYFKRALISFQKINNLRRIAEIRHNIGMVYTKLNKFDTAIKEFDQAISISFQISYLPTIAISYLSKAFIYTKQEDFVLADAFADKSMEFAYKLNDKLSIADIYKIKGIIQREMGKYQAAENYLLTSLRLNKELKNKLNAAETSSELGILYKVTGDLKQSSKFFKRALEYYRSIDSERDIKIIEDLIS